MKSSQRRSFVFRALTLAGLALPLAPALAQAAYPNKPIRLVVPFPAGGATDAAAREIGESLARTLGQQVLVENRPGGDGAVAAQAVLQSPADGYTLLFGSSSMEGLPFVQKAAPFASLNDFTPISLVCRLAFGMVAHAGLPAASVQEFVAYAQARPDQVAFGAGSLSELMAATQFMKSTGTRLNKVSYKGGAQMVPDLAAGRIQVSFGPYTPMIPYVKDGKMKAIATLLDQRAGVLPEVPTLREAGVAGVSGAGGLQAIFAPPKAPAEVAERIGAAVKTALAEQNIRDRFLSRGQQPEASTPQGLADLIRAEHAGWKGFVAENGIQPE